MTVETRWRRRGMTLRSDRPTRSRFERRGGGGGDDGDVLEIVNRVYYLANKSVTKDVTKTYAVFHGLSPSLTWWKFKEDEWWKSGRNEWD